MKELQKELDKTELRIKDLDRQLDGLDTHPYYQIFNRHLEKKLDKEKLLLALYDQLSLERVLLENMQLEAQKRLQKNSQNQRIVTHQKAN